MTLCFLVVLVLLYGWQSHVLLTKRRFSTAFRDSSVGSVHSLAEDAVPAAFRGDYVRSLHVNMDPVHMILPIGHACASDMYGDQAGGRENEIWLQYSTRLCLCVNIFAQSLSIHVLTDRSHLAITAHSRLARPPPGGRSRRLPLPRRR